MWRRLKLATFILISLLIINGLARSILRNLKNAQRISDLREEVAEMERRNAELRSAIEYRKSADYLEKEARERLGYLKEGEVVIILPGVGQLEDQGNAGDGGVVASAEDEKPPLEQWKEVFFGVGY